MDPLDEALRAMWMRCSALDTVTSDALVHNTDAKHVFVPFHHQGYRWEGEYTLRQYTDVLVHDDGTDVLVPTKELKLVVPVESLPPILEPSVEACFLTERVTAFFSEGAIMYGCWFEEAGTRVLQTYSTVPDETRILFTVVFKQDTPRHVRNVSYYDRILLT